MSERLTAWVGRMSRAHAWLPASLMAGLFVFTGMLLSLWVGRRFGWKRWRVPTHTMHALEQAHDVLTMIVIGLLLAYGLYDCIRTGRWP